MRRTVILNVGAAWLLVGGWASADGGRPSDARLRDGAEGAEVRNRPNGAWHPAAPKSYVTSGSELHCPRGCALVLDGGGIVTLADDTVIAIAEPTFVQLEPGKSPTKASQVQLREGRIQALAKSGGGAGGAGNDTRPVAIATRGGLVGIGTGTGATQVSAQGERAAAVADGPGVRIALGGIWSGLDPTSEAVWGGKAKGEIRPRISAPAWTVATGAAGASRASGDPCPHRLVFLRGESALRVGGCWKPVADAVRYRVELARDSEFKDVVASREVVDTAYFSDPVGAGRYFQRVAATDGFGMWGAPSKPAALAVIGLKLPPGGGASGELGVELHDVGDIQLAERAGLELARDHGGFIPAPLHLVLEDGAVAHTFRLRLAGDADSETPLELFRSAVRAQISMSPNTARWPQDPIDVVVSLDDPSGRGDLIALAPKLTVMVGTSPIDVTWKREGNRFTTSIAPRRMYGPTVVRVVAEDAGGAPLGRNFLEIAGEAGDLQTVIETHRTSRIIR